MKYNHWKCSNRLNLKDRETPDKKVIVNSINLHSELDFTQTVMDHLSVSSLQTE